MQCVGFQFLMILDLWDISFHAVLVFGSGNNLLFKSILLGPCGMLKLYFKEDCLVEKLHGQ